MRRLAEHNAGRVQSTKFYRPWDMVYVEEFASHLEAARREREIKKKGTKFRERLTQGKAEGSKRPSK